jgi:hypothetical protein
MKREKKGKLITPEQVELVGKIIEVLNGDYGEEARRCLLQCIEANKRYFKLKAQGINVTLPAPRLGRPRFLVISGKK